MIIPHEYMAVIRHIVDRLGRGAVRPRLDQGGRLAVLLSGLVLAIVPGVWEYISSRRLRKIAESQYAGGA